MCCCNKKCKYAHVCFNEKKDRACDGFCLNEEAIEVLKNMLLSTQNILKTIDTLKEISSDKNISDDLHASLTNNINSIHRYLELSDIEATTRFIMTNVKNFDGRTNAFINTLICTV